MTRDASRRAQERLVALVAAAAAIVYAAVVPGSSSAHTDHVVFLGTLDRMKAGAGYYGAFRGAFLDVVNIRVGQARDFREPAPFLVWRWLPTSALFVTFLALVVLTVWLLAQVSRSPFAALPAGAFLILATRTTITEWMLVELWAAPLIAGCVLAWKRERAWTSALLALAVVLVRETAAPLLLAGLALSILRRRPRAPWSVAIGTAAGLFALHYAIAAASTLSHGTEASLQGTGRPPQSVFDMLTWPFQQERPLSTILVLLWAVVPFAVWSQRRSIGPLVGLLAIPATGLFIDRPYWGLLATPFALWLSADALVAWISGHRRCHTPAIGS